MHCSKEATKRGYRYFVVHDAYLNDRLIISEVYPVDINHTVDWKVLFGETVSITTSWNEDGTLCTSTIEVVHR